MQVVPRGRSYGLLALKTESTGIYVLRSWRADALNNSLRLSALGHPAARRMYCTQSKEDNTTSRKRHRGYWSEAANQKEFLDSIKQTLGVKEFSDWYSVTRKALIKNGGRCLFEYHASMESLLKSCYPEYNWQASRFLEAGNTPQGYWEEPVNQREWLDKIGAELGVRKLSDWYSISRAEITARGGKGLFRKHALSKVLRSAYPEFEWEDSRFVEEGKAPMGYWHQKDNLFKALDKVATQMGIQSPEDWYSIRMTDLIELGFPATISKRQLADLLAEKYPGYQWEKVLMLRGRFAQQKRLENAIFSLFPGEAISINARKEADLVNPENKEYLELDVYLPSLKLAFEYQEQHHYVSADYTYKPVDAIQKVDQLKRHLAKEKGITLILIPCWWDGRKESLVATIKEKRPDLLTNMESDAQPIPEQVPPNYFDKHTDNIEGIGQPSNACFLTKTHYDPENWWLFEKYDGVRAFWNPLKRAFYSRRGREFTMPKDVVDSMPQDLFLDGELWFGRENFQESMKIAHRMDDKDIDWSKFRFMVFDLPTMNDKYQARYEQLVNALSGKEWKYIEIAPKVVCRSMSHLEHFFQDIVDKGGEGIILRDPNAELQPGRDPGYLKHKKFRDAEAKVLGSVGTHQWECQLPNGIKFVAAAATTEFTKRWNPQPGDIVSFKHHGFLLATKKPKLPVLYRMRNELNWNDVVNNWKESKSTPSAWPLRRPITTHKPKGYWKDVKNRQKFFIDLAQELGFDHTNPDNWQNVSQSIIFTRKGAGLLGLFNNSLKAALEQTFPNFEYKAKQKDRGHWRDIKNRRDVLLEFANEMGFDPLVPDNWLNVSAAQFIAKKGRGPLLPFGNSLRATLQNTFPEIYGETNHTTTQRL